MATVSSNRKPLPELDVDLAELPRLIAAARDELGVSATIARNMAGWILGRQHGQDEASSGTAWRYRQVLKQLEEAGFWSPPPGRTELAPQHGGTRGVGRNGGRRQRLANMELVGLADGAGSPALATAWPSPTLQPIIDAARKERGRRAARRSGGATIVALTRGNARREVRIVCATSIGSNAHATRTEVAA